MAIILQNNHVSPEVCIMTLKGLSGKCGQFYMLHPGRGGVTDPLLGRPFCVYDCSNGNCSFLYRVAGKGTKILESMRPGDDVPAYGPYGNGFEPVDSDIVLIGGGIGIAPLYFLATTHKKMFPDRSIDAYFGFVEKPFMLSYFRAIVNDIHVNVGGYITSDVPFARGNEVLYYACGPTPMMRAAKEVADRMGCTLYVSLEERMACGVGACLGCTCHTKSGNKRVCTDGPVFLASEVSLDE